MRTFGDVKYENGQWQIRAQPHVMIRLKAVLGKVNKSQFGEITLKDSPEVCRDVEWFMQRYSLAIDERSNEALRTGSNHYRRTMESLEEIAKPDFKPRTFKLALPAREYQARAVELYLKRKGLLVADQLGLGKSITAMCSFTERETLPALIVCTTHLQSQWMQYLAKFLPGMRAHIIKTGKNYPLPSADVYIITYHKLWCWVEILKGLVKSMVFDECQELRRTESTKYYAALTMRQHVDYTMGLSATPIYNYGGEIHNIMEIILPGALGTREEFEREWCTYRGPHALLKNPDAFGTYLRDEFLMVRRTRKEVGRELPPVQTMVQTVEHDAKCLEQIDSVATELAHRILKGCFEEQGRAAREFDMRMRQATGISKAPFVAEFVRMLIEESSEKVLLCGWHREVYDVWRSHFERGPNPICPVFYTGTESPTQKEQARADFLEGRSPVMIMSLRSGVGLDGLQEGCSVIVHGELDWSPGVHEQCRGRLYRDGQDNHISEFYLISDGGSDPIIADTLGLKKAQVTGLLEPGGTGLLKLQTDAGARVKEMAKSYLAKRGALLPN